jgi:hypothetical protein
MGSLYTPRTKRTLLLSGAAIFSALAITAGVRTDHEDNADENNRSTAIVSTTVDFTASQVTIEGKNFPSRPVVTLDGTPLTLISNNRTEIVASLQPVAGLENQPGDYLVTVSRSREERGEEGERHRAATTFVVTIGGAGPTGPPGPKGDTGPQGPPGVFSGHFQSPNGAYSLDVTNNGIVLTGPAAKIQIVGGTATVSGTSVKVQADLDAELKGGATATVNSGGNTTVKAGALVVVTAPLVTIN